jgi:hypothetical protein
MKAYVYILLLVAACFLLVSAYNIGYNAGENSGELAFQKEKEKTRKAEYANLMRSYEEAKQEEKTRWREAQEKALDERMLKLWSESKDREAAINIKLLELMSQKPQY